MPPTLKQIADELGVSTMTVSRSIRGVGRVGEKTRQLVREMADRMGYQMSQGIVIPPPIRRGKADHRLKLLVPSISIKNNARAGAWFFDRLFRGLQSRLNLSNGSYDQEYFGTLDHLIQAWHEQRYQGVVLHQPLPYAWVQKLVAIGPVVYAIEYDFHLGLDSVYGNEQRAVVMALDQIEQQGHRQIAWLGINDYYSPYQIGRDLKQDTHVSDCRAASVHQGRFAAWANFAYCSDHQRYLPMVLMKRDWRNQSLDEVVEQGLDQILASPKRATVIVCASDPVAISLIKALRQRHISVPKQMSVVSYGGDPNAKQHTPPLTTLDMPMETIGRSIPELIERRLANPDAKPVSMQFEMTWSQGKTLVPPPQ